MADSVITHMRQEADTPNASQVGQVGSHEGQRTRYRS